LREQTARFGQQRGAGTGERNAAPVAVEQRRTEQLLERKDRLLQRRLRHVKARGGAAEMELLGDGDEIAQLAQLDGNGHIL
jgi:hypothetical protein